MALHIQTTLNGIAIDFLDFIVYMVYVQNDYSINLIFGDWLIFIFQTVRNQFDYG